MAYTKTIWTNDSGEPLDAANLNHIETGIGDAHDDIATIQAWDADDLNYTSAASGAVTRTIENALDDMPSVGDFGPTADGVTDDRAKIVLADTAASRTMLVPDGSFAVASNLTIGSRVHYMGKLVPGAGVVIQDANPLKFSDFLAKYNDDEQAALQAAVNQMLNGSGEYSYVLDLEGRKVNLTDPITAPSSVTNFDDLYIINGTFIVAATNNFANTDHMFALSDATKIARLTFSNCAFLGQNAAGFLSCSTEGTFIFERCRLFNNDDTAGTPGIYLTGNTTLRMYDSHMGVNDGATAPGARVRIGVDATVGDQKIYNSVFEYFKNAIIFRGGTGVISGCHIFQGYGTEMTAHTAGIVLTSGRSGTSITDCYIDKCFIELSNEDASADGEIGNVLISGIKGLANSNDSSFAWVRAVDYQSSTVATVADIIIADSHWMNYGSTEARLTNLVSPVNFDRDACERIYVHDNCFRATNPEANPVTVRKTFSSAVQQHSVVFTDLLPFRSRPHRCTGFTIEYEATAWTTTTWYVGNVNIAADTIRFDSSDATSGIVHCTADCNADSANEWVAT